MENKIKQLRKGVLELAIMSCLYHKSLYGYSLVKTLSDEGDISLSEGTIYPILSRLSKEGMVASEWIESSQGPPRKYYSLTQQGENTFEVLHKEFQKLTKLINHGQKESLGQKKEAEGKKLSIKKEENHGE